MKHLNDFSFGDMEYSTYKDLRGGDDGFIVDIKNANGELEMGSTGFESEEQAIEWAEQYLLDHFT